MEQKPGVSAHSACRGVCRRPPLPLLGLSESGVDAANKALPSKCPHHKSIRCFRRGDLAASYDGSATSFSAQLPKSLDEGEMDLEVFKDLHKATDFAFKATKKTAQASRRSMGFMVLHRHLWLTLTELKDADRKALFLPPVSLEMPWRPLWSTSQKLRNAPKQ